MPPSDNPSASGEDDRYEVFVARFAHYEPDLRRFIRSLLPTWTDTDEVLQQTAIVIWRKFDQYDPDTNFMKWACVIARFEALAYRRKMARDRLVFREDVLELMADEGAEELDSRRAEHDALESCLLALPEKQRKFITLACTPGVKVKDDRLIAYYTFDRENGQALIPNAAVPRNPEFDGAVVLAEPVDGRWPGMTEALEFRRPGSRVRVNLPGEFPAFSFVAWVRIDSLDRWYNALFMADSYETGEPHWQIRDDGRMILSVMVDDSRPNPKNPDGQPIRFQRLYYSPPMWDPSMSGRWLHLTSVFDPENRRVSHYVNGERISREEINPEHLIKTLRIGNAEIGNWGQPFREDPTFAIRNLNGRMDEIAIFKAALRDEEIAELYERSRCGQR